MPAEVIQFRCPCCGMHAPLTRLTEEGPFELAEFKKTLGGKVKMTSEDRMARKGRKEPRTGRGNARGRLDYVEVDLSRDLQEAFQSRIRELGGGAAPTRPRPPRRPTRPVPREEEEETEDE